MNPRTPFFVVLIVFLAGCALHRDGNWYKYSKGGMFSSGRRDYLGWDKLEFNGIYIGSYNKNPPYDKSIKFSIRLADGTVLSSDEFDYETIRKHANKGPVARHVYFGEIKIYDIFVSDNFYFTYNPSYELIQFSAYGQNMHSSEGPATIGKYDKSRFYTFPLTKEQLYEIFGEPDDLSANWKG
jgi:hypothetical protein